MINVRFVDDIRDKNNTNFHELSPFKIEPYNHITIIVQ